MKRLLQKIKQKTLFTWSDETAKISVRIANYTLAAAILFGFWVAGQATRQPDQNAYASIMQVAKLPVWLTMGSNNNNSNSCSPSKYQLCANLLISGREPAQEAIDKIEQIENLVEQIQSGCGSDACEDEFNDVLFDAGVAIGSASAMVSATIFSSGATLGPFITTFILERGLFVAALISLKDSWEDYQNCINECEELKDEVNQLFDELDSLTNEINNIVNQLINNDCDEC